jgi:hypothetical protein
MQIIRRSCLSAKKRVFTDLITIRVVLNDVSRAVEPEISASATLARVQMKLRELYTSIQRFGFQGRVVQCPNNSSSLRIEASHGLESAYQIHPLHSSSDVLSRDVF